MLMRTVCLSPTWAVAVLFLPAISSPFAWLLPFLTSRDSPLPSPPSRPLLPPRSWLTVLPSIPSPSVLPLSEMSPAPAFCYSFYSPAGYYVSLKARVLFQEGREGGREGRERGGKERKERRKRETERKTFTTNYCEMLSSLLGRLPLVVLWEPLTPGLGERVDVSIL